MKRPLLTLCPALVLLGIVLLPACRTARFYSQAVQGQADILARSRPIGSVIRSKTSTPSLRKQLELVQDLRAFADERLRLPTDRQYRNYADLGRKFVVWNVYAAPEFSLKARTWRYPLVGSLKYRGFFNEDAAKKEAAGLKEQGYDVVVGGVRVYSTLGWFSDPVLNTFVEDKEAQLAETLFHELTHARFFVGGDTDFNEAYATASGQEGVRQRFLSKGDTASLQQYERDLAEFNRILKLLQQTRDRLEALYETQETTPVETLRLGKARILDEARAAYAAMKRRGECDDSYDRLFSKQLNNARLTALATYYDLVPAFHHLFQQQDRDWEKFHRAVAAMKPLSKEARRQRLGAPSEE